jgi:hypothetical protein
MRCWTGRDTFCQLKHDIKACPMEGPRMNREARVISVDAQSRKLILANFAPVQRYG